MSLNDLEKKYYFPTVGKPIEVSEYAGNNSEIYHGYFKDGTYKHGVICFYTYDTSGNTLTSSYLVDVAWADRATLSFP